MSDSLRDQLLGLGFKPAPRTEKPKPTSGAPGSSRTHAGSGGAPHRGSKPKPPRPAGGAPRRSGEMDLAKAYAIRAQREKEERIAAERQRQLEAQRRREAKAALATLLARASLNDAAAEVARHFEYGGKIRRIYVTPDQLRALNAGELGVVQHAGRYHLLSAAHVQEADALLPGARALLVDPAAPVQDDPYSDPRFQVPDDLIW